MYCMECRKYVGLTLTWDVLKRKGDLVHVMAGTGLTLTWDVLKQYDAVAPGRYKKE